MVNKQLLLRIIHGTILILFAGLLAFQKGYEKGMFYTACLKILKRLYDASCTTFYFILVNGYYFK